MVAKRSTARHRDEEKLSQTKVNMRELLLRATDILVAKCKDTKPSYTRSILIEYALTRYLMEISGRTIQRPTEEEMSRFSVDEIRRDLRPLLD